MKLFVRIAAALFAAVFFCSFGGIRSDTVTGQVVLHGNMPFSFPGFTTDDGHEYTIVVDEKKSDKHLLEKLISLQGQLIELRGRINPPEKAQKAGIKMLRDGEFVVYSYRIVPFKGIGKDN